MLFRSDSDLTNNQMTITTPVTTKAKLIVQKQVDKEVVLKGEWVTYTLVVTNLGPSDAKAAQMTDTVPASLASVVYSIDEGKTWSSWSGTYMLPTLAVGGTKQVFIKGKVASV